MLLIFGICLCLVVGVVLYARLVFGDPGFTLESKRKENGTFYTMKDLVQLRKPGVWCTICQLIPTKPSKHCKLCNRCVYWMDHHCLYTMRCIGKRNYYTFVWFNFVLVAGLGQTLLLFPGYAEHLGYKHAWMELPSPLFYWCCLKYIFMNQGLLFVVLMGMSLSFCNTLYLFYLTLSNISHGYTSYFRPPEGRRPYQSGLAYTDRLSNLTTFIRYGQIKIQDPNFVI
ncbi:hypothetical protein EB796_004912 [Bugula neritina]|uniref:Palmitoyltransferase n=1 Tax=Bugula neritina TaxID=10212 RepID=A0A7J7KH14_BUGNE|nr:hypothetical protein EB796_004912 [Bugula neritina]